MKGLELEKIQSHPWHVQVAKSCVFFGWLSLSDCDLQAACATSGAGLDEGFDWLAAKIGDKKKTAAK